MRGVSTAFHPVVADAAACPSRSRHAMPAPLKCRYLVTRGLDPTDRLRTWSRSPGGLKQDAVDVVVGNVQDVIGVERSGQVDGHRVGVGGRGENDRQRS